jgi:hypothetical protein
MTPAIAAITATTARTTARIVVLPRRPPDALTELNVSSSESLLLRAARYRFSRSVLAGIGKRRITPWSRGPRTG